MVLSALLAGNTLFATVIGTPQVQFRHLYALNANGRVVIQNLYGDVSITAWDRDEVLVEAIKRSPDPRHLNDARIVVDPSADLVSIRTQYAGSDARASRQRGIPHYRAAERQPGERQADQRGALDQRAGGFR